MHLKVTVDEADEPVRNIPVRSIDAGRRAAAAEYAAYLAANAAYDSEAEVFDWDGNGEYQIGGRYYQIII